MRQFNGFCHNIPNEQSEVGVMLVHHTVFGAFQWGWKSRPGLRFELVRRFAWDEKYDFNPIIHFSTSAPGRRTRRAVTAQDHGRRIKNGAVCRQKFVRLGVWASTRILKGVSLCLTCFLVGSPVEWSFVHPTTKGDGRCSFGLVGNAGLTTLFG